MSKRISKMLFSKERVDLGLQEDMQKLINDTDEIVQDVEQISDAAQRALNIANSSSSNIKSLMTKIDKKLNEVESAAKDLGVDAKSVKGYDKLSRISKQVLKNYDSYVQRASKDLRSLIMS